MSAHRKSSKRQLSPEILRVLDSSGLDWLIRPKAKHNQLVIADVVVLTMPRSPGHGRCKQDLNAAACVKRFVRDHAPRTI